MKVGTKMNIELTLNKLAKKHGFEYQWQQTKYDTRRAAISCSSYNQLSYICNVLSRVKNIEVATWMCFECEYEGRIYIMTNDDANKLRTEQNAEQNRLNNWWNRYHIADMETRKLMACGAIE